MTKGSFVAFGVVGVPDSQVHVELGEDGVSPADAIEAAVAMARLLADEYRREFYPDEPEQ